MAINAVSPSAGAAAQAVKQAKPQQAQAQKTEASGSADEAAKARKAQQQQAQKTEPAKPVVNAQGQTTGRVVNVTA